MSKPGPNCGPPPTMVDPHLEQAFRNTDYRVELNGSWHQLAINAPCPAALAAWLSRQRTHIGWLITAWNPGARLLDADTNSARNTALTAWVAQHELAHLNSVNAAPDETWPNEPGLLIAGIGEDLARALAIRFGQLALVVVTVDAPTRLLWMPNGRNDRDRDQDRGDRVPVA